MHVDNRRSYRAAGRCLIAALALTASAHAQPAGRNGSAPPSTQQGQAAVAPNPQPIFPPAVQDAIERAARAIEAANNDPNAATERQRAQDDLEAQQSVAKWAKWIFFATFVQVVVGGAGIFFLIANLRESRTLTKAALRANARATRANVIARETYIADQRAWLTTVMSVDGNLDFRYGVWSASASVSVKITNVGKTPALEAHTNIKLILPDCDVPGAVRALCDESKVVTAWGRLVLPGESYDRLWRPSLDAENIEGKTIMSLIVIGCVTYQILPDKSLHQTAFAYWISPRQGFIEPNKTFTKDEVELTVTTGGFAD